MNVARAVITAKAGAIKTASDVAPDVIEGTRSGTRFLGSVIRAANSTAPLILDVSRCSECPSKSGCFYS